MSVFTLLVDLPLRMFSRAGGVPPETFQVVSSVGVGSELRWEDVV
jgi:hypothetical protein